MLLAKKRNILVCIAILALVCFILHDLKGVIAFFQYDVNAPDIIGDGVKLRNKYHSSYYDMYILFPMLTSKINTIILPLMFFISMYYYNKHKNKIVKYTIGKTSNTKKYLLNLKFKSVLLSLIFYYTIIFIYFLVSWYLTNLKEREPGFRKTFLEGTFLHFADDSVSWYMFFLILTTTLYVIASVLLLTTIVDYKYNYIIIFIVYFLGCYLGSDFLALYVNRNLSLALSASTGLGLVTNYQLFTPYICMLVIYIFFKLTHKKEF